MEKTRPSTNPNSEVPADSQGSRQVHAEQVRLLFTQGPVSMVATIVNSSLLALILWKATPHGRLVLWLGLTFALVWLRLLLVRGYRRVSPQPERSSTWAALFVLGLAASGFLLGSTGIYLFPADSFPRQVFMIFLVGGMVAGAAGTYSVLLQAYFAYSVLAVFPIAIRMFAQGTQMQMAMAVMLLLFFALMSATAYYVHNATTRSLELRFQNTSLVARLRTEKAHAEHLVEALREEITVRKRAESALRLAHDELEQRVAERTSELANANEELRAEIDERNRAEETITRQNEFLNQVIESLTHPFYVLDATDYSVKMANTAAGLGEFLPGSACYSLTHKRTEPCHGTEHDCPIETIKRTKQPLTLTHIHYDENGNPRTVEIHAYPILGKDGNVVQIIEYALDVTERKRLEAAMEKNAEKIKIFAYSVSHDIKSPLIGINGITKLLHKQYRNVLDERGQKYCDHILKASEQLVALVEEINLFIRTKETPLTFEVIDPNEIIRFIKEEFSALLEARRINWSQAEGIPRIKADRISMLRVFRNLVDNALKYGGSELTEIDVGYEKSDDFHTFSVSDNGTGIPGEAAEQIFEIFRRNSKGGQAEGAGLGLAIVKDIVEKHSGKVWVESNVSRGTTFFFSVSERL